MTETASSSPRRDFGVMRPALPFALGLAGLVPFWGLAVAHVLEVPRGWPVGTVAFALAVYAATIASFLGGIRWGLAIRTPDQTRVGADYIGGVLPQLLGWGALALPDPWRFAALGLLLLILGPLDRNLVSRDMAPAWFGRLRVILSLGAGAALFLAALA